MSTIPSQQLFECTLVAVYTLFVNDSQCSFNGRSDEVDRFTMPNSMV